MRDRLARTILRMRARGNFFGRSSKPPFSGTRKNVFSPDDCFRFKPSERRTVSYGGRCDSAHGVAPLRCLSAPRLAKIWGFSGQRAHARLFCACRRLWPTRGHCINCNISRSIARMHLIFCVISISFMQRDRYRTKDEAHACCRSQDIDGLHL